MEIKHSQNESTVRELLIKANDSVSKKKGKKSILAKWLQFEESCGTKKSI